MASRQLQRMIRNWNSVLRLAAVPAYCHTWLLAVPSGGQASLLVIPSTWQMSVGIHSASLRLAQPSTDNNKVGDRSESHADAWTLASREEKKKKEEEQKTADEEEEIKNRILNAGLSQVHKHGWTRLAITAGAESAGYLGVVSGLFLGEGVDLVLYHVRKSNRELDKWMESETKSFKECGQKIPVTKFIRSAVERRLRMNTDFVKSKRWGEAMAILAHPMTSVEALGCIQELADDIWHRAGDTSHDMSWYSKRISLAAIYAATEVFMLQDSSPDFHDTWKFLDRRFEDLNTLPQISSLPKDVGGLLAGLATTARNIAGLQSGR